MTWLLSHFVAYIEEGCIWCINQFIISIGLLMQAIVDLLPPMPSFPSIPLPTGMQEWFDYGAYWFPFGYMVTLVGVILALWVGWIVVAIPLRWAKGIRGNQ